MHEILDPLGDAKYMTSLDVQNEFWQVPLEENSRKYTAFTVPEKGHFQYKLLAMGLHGSAQTFQRLVDKLFNDLKPHVFVYLDDLFIVAPDFQTYNRILEEVFTRLKNNNLTLRKEKCIFCTEELEYLGFIINKSGLSVNPKKISATDMRQF